LNDLTTGARTQIFGDPLVNVVQTHWTPDSKGFYATSAYSGHPRYVMAAVMQLYHYNLQTRSATKVDLGWERGLSLRPDGSALAVTRDGFLAILADGAQRKAARYYRAGSSWRRQWLTGEHTSYFVSVDL